MSIVITRPRKNRKSPPQPLDRHLSEIGELDGTVYINAGIDSTWLVIKNSFLSQNFITFLFRFIF